MSKEFKEKVTIIAFSANAEIYDFVLMKIGAFLMTMQNNPELMGYPCMTDEVAAQLKVTQQALEGSGDAFDILPRLKELFNRGYDLRKDGWMDDGEWWNEIAPFVPYLWY